MFGKANLKEFNNADEFIRAFIDHFTDKMEKAINPTKFDKAQSPEAIKKAQDTKNKLEYGIEFVSKLMQ
jgi:hypothetical protein